MTAELLPSTLGAATLAVPMGVSDTTMTLNASPPPGFGAVPSGTGQFRVAIASPINGLIEILLVQSPPASGNVYTVTRAAEGPNPASVYPQGWPVTVALTTAALQALLSAGAGLPIRVNANGSGGAQSSPYSASPGDFAVADTSLGSVVVNGPVLGIGQSFTVKHDENTSLASATVTVNGPSSPSAVNLAQPPPNNNPGNPGGGFVPSIVFGGAGGGVFAGESARGMGGKWMNVGSGGGYVLVS